MQLQDQVIPLPMAQRLKELGVKQESLFFWLDLPETIYRRQSTIIAGPTVLESATDQGEKWSAFTIPELLELITDTPFGSTYWIRIYHGAHVQLLIREQKLNFSGQTPTCALCEMLIYLLEHKHLNNH